MLFPPRTPREAAISHITGSSLLHLSINAYAPLTDSTARQCHALRRVLGQATKVRLHITELALDRPEQVVDLGTHLCVGLLDLALGFVQRVALIEFLIRSATGRDLPNYLTAYMLRAFLYAGVMGARSSQSFSSTAPSTPSRLGIIRCGPAYPYQRIQPRRKPSASSENSAGGIREFYQNQEISLRAALTNQLAK